LRRLKRFSVTARTEELEKGIGLPLRAMTQQALRA
jgi:hypothetical protein